MQAFLAILQYDVGQLVRSWLVRIWIGLLVGPAIFLVAVAANEAELASETLAVYVTAVLAPFSALAIAVIAASAVSGESGIIADSILSRSVTRTEYMSAKIVARLGFVIAVYIAVMIPFAYLVVRYGVTDTSAGGVATGLLMVASLLLFLAALGITMSAVFPNVLVAVLVVLVSVVLSGFIFQFLGVNWLSSTAVVEALPRTFRGQTPVWDQVRVLMVFSTLTGAAVFASVWMFRRRDL